MDNNQYNSENCIKLIGLHNHALVSFRCYESIYTAIDGVVPLPADNEKEVGCHAVDIIGYSREAGYFKFANSWGKKWGDSGFGYLPFEYFKNGRIIEMYAAIF